MQDKLSISNISKAKIPVLPILDLKNEILGKNYNLSVAIVTPKVSKEINKKYRNKNKPTNVLSFPFSKKEGELVLCPSVIKKESENKNKNFGKNYQKLFGFLVIHGMLHLKGLDHSVKMENLEKKFEQKYLSRTKFLKK